MFIPPNCLYKNIICQESQAFQTFLLVKYIKLVKLVVQMTMLFS